MYYEMTRGKITFNHWWILW